MGGLAEEALVLDDDFQNRDLQAADQHLHRRRQVVVVQNEFEQHGHQVDEVFIHLAQGSGFLALGSISGNQALNNLAQVYRHRFAAAEIAGLRPHLLCRQGAEQVHQFLATDHPH